VIFKIPPQSEAQFNACLYRRQLCADCGSGCNLDDPTILPPQANPGIKSQMNCNSFGLEEQRRLVVNCCVFRLARNWFCLSSNTGWVLWQCETKATSLGRIRRSPLFGYPTQPPSHSSTWKYSGRLSIQNMDSIWVKSLSFSPEIRLLLLQIILPTPGYPN